MFGDTRQCDPVEKGHQIYYDYFDSVAISEMCPKRVQMKYKEGCSRYDIKTKDMLTKFLETGKVTTKFAEREPLYKNICYLNSTRQKVRTDSLQTNRVTLSLFMIVIRKFIKFVSGCPF